MPPLCICYTLLWNRLLRKQRNEQVARLSRFATSCTGRRPYPTGPLGGDATGRGVGILPADHSPELGMAKNTTSKRYSEADAPPTKKLSAKERAKAEALPASPMATD